MTQAVSYWKIKIHGGEKDMQNITSIAARFFEACETGKGWEICKAFCKDNASFSAQAEPLIDVVVLRDYTEWMKWLLVVIPDGRYTIKSFATDDSRNSVCAFGTFSGTHTGHGGPCAPTGRTLNTDYVYAIEFTDDRIHHVTKIWNAGWALKELGWA